MSRGAVDVVRRPCAVCGRAVLRPRRVCEDCAGTGSRVDREPELETEWGRTRQRVRRRFLEDVRAELGGELPFPEREVMKAALWMDEQFTLQNREQDYRRGVEMVARAVELAAERGRRVMDALYWIVRDALE